MTRLIARLSPLAIALAALPFRVAGQDPTVDSLRSVIAAHRITGGPSDTAQALRYATLARSFTAVGDLDSALWACDRALVTLKGITTGKSDAHLLDRSYLQVHKNQGIAHFYRNDYAPALTAIQQFQRVAERMGSTADIGASYNYMSYCFRGMGDTTNAKAIALKAIEVLRSVPEDEDIANAYSGLANIYTDAQQGDSSLHYNRLALAIYNRTGNLLNATNTRMNMAEVFLRLNRFDSSLAYLQEARPAVEQIQETSTMVKFHGQMGRALLAQGQMAEASVELDRAEELARELENDEDLGHIHDLKALAAAARGDFPTAFDRVDKARGAMMRDMDLKKAQELTEARLTFVHEREQALIESALDEQRRFKTYALIGGALLLAYATLLLVLYRITRRSREAVRLEKEVSDGLLRNILPAEVASELKEHGRAVARQFDRATILFTDFKEFTQLSEQLSPTELVGELDHCFKAFDAIIAKRGVEKIKTIGDSYMCAGGLPDPARSSPADVVLAALEMQAFMKERAAQRHAEGRPIFQMRAGVHTGPVVAGIVGVNKFQYDIWGDTVNTASRMESSGEVGQVNISGATYALVREEAGRLFDFTPRGKVRAKGKGELEMYYVEAAVMASA